MPKNIDINLEYDTDLEKEADKAGMIHLRKHTGQTEMLPGYGTTNFGVSAYETKRFFTPSRIYLTSGLATAGLVALKFKNGMKARFQTVVTYALLLREASR